MPRGKVFVGHSYQYMTDKNRKKESSNCTFAEPYNPATANVATVFNGHPDELGEEDRMTETEKAFARQYRWWWINRFIGHL